MKPRFLIGRRARSRRSRRPRLKFFLDNCVPDSVGRVLVAYGHTVIYQRNVIAKDAPDLVVALTSAANDAILISTDKDFRAIAARFEISHKNLKRLSRIELRCSEPEAANRVKQGISFIEAEWVIARDAPDRRIFIEIQGYSYRTHR